MSATTAKHRELERQSDQRTSGTVWVLWVGGTPLAVFDDETDAFDAAEDSADVVEYERVKGGEHG